MTPLGPVSGQACLLKAETRSGKTDQATYPATWGHVAAKLQGLKRPRRRPRLLSPLRLLVKWTLTKSALAPHTHVVTTTLRSTSNQLLPSPNQRIPRKCTGKTPACLQSIKLQTRLENPEHHRKEKQESCAKTPTAFFASLSSTSNNTSEQAPRSAQVSRPSQSGDHNPMECPLLAYCPRQ